jgi:hypothetical protein
MRSQPFGFALTSALVLVVIALVCVAEDATPHEARLEGFDYSYPGGAILIRLPSSEAV